MSDPIFLIGPTCVGKSELAISLAQHISAEIVSCDSMQVYRGMDIGTDKPSNECRKKVKHHLIDILNPIPSPALRAPLPTGEREFEEYNVGRYVEDANRVIKDIQNRGKIPLVVGGTGLYIKALIDGLFIGPGKDEVIRNKLEEMIEREGLSSVYEELKKRDPVACTKIKPKDKRRIIRALEVYYITGRPISSFQNQWEKKTDCIIIGLDRLRKDLYKRIDKRVDEMFERGLVEETKVLLQKGIMQNKTASQALGYKEVLGYLEGRYDLDKAKDLLKINTRRFAKRQLTWFKKDDRVNWFLIREDEEIESVIKRIIEFLGKKM